MVNYELKYLLENFTRNVFNYYNGRINICCNAKLNIEWISNFSRLGDFSLPNTVTVYLGVITKNFTGVEEAKSIIIMTILHELHHADQFIDYPQMYIYQEYQRDIEGQVELLTMNYIASHINEIDVVFGVKMIRNSSFYTTYLRKYISSTMYVRLNSRTLVERLLLNLDNYLSRVYFIIKDNFNKYANFNISIDICDKDTILMHDNISINNSQAISESEQVLYSIFEFLYSNDIVKYRIDIRDNKDTGDIKIKVYDIEHMNILCTIKEEY